MVASREQYWDLGILVFRLGLSLVFLKIGLYALFIGPVAWEEVGFIFQSFGIDEVSKELGLFISILEIVSALLVLSGFFFKYACLALFLLSMVYLQAEVTQGFNFEQYFGYILIATISLGLILTGAGTYALN